VCFVSFVFQAVSLWEGPFSPATTHHRNNASTCAAVDSRNASRL
jgi:hypothetical protein